MLCNQVDTKQHFGETNFFRQWMWKLESSEMQLRVVYRTHLPRFWKVFLSTSLYFKMQISRQFPYRFLKFLPLDTTLAGLFLSIVLRKSSITCYHTIKYTKPIFLSIILRKSSISWQNIIKYVKPIFYFYCFTVHF